ncbi:MAG: sulfurtransferase TusA family protein [Ostreibacterium sp.]
MADLAHLSVDSEVDATGLNCPLPILKARKALMYLTIGQVLKITTTDPTSADDFPVFAEATHNTLLGVKKEGEQFCYYLRVGQD